MQDVKEKNKLISSLISRRSTECTTKQPFLVTNSYKHSSEGNERESNMDRNCKNKLKKIGVTREFQPKAKRNFFYFISHQVKIYLQRFAAYVTKMLYRNVLCMQLQVCIKTMLHFINKRSKMFDFKTFENMKLLYITVTKDYDQRRQLDILIKDAMIWRNIAILDERL